MMQLFRKDRMWTPRPLKSRYDVVIIGAGVHGLATAYYLTKLGITDIAVLDKSYIGAGASARSTAILRANYITAEGIPFFRESLKLYETLSQDLDFNLMFDQMGRLDLGHTDSAVYGLRVRAEFNQMLGVDSSIIGPDEIKDLVPAINLRTGQTLPIMAALYHPPAGTIRHDAVVWAYGRGADHGGAQIHPFTEVTGFLRDGNRVTGVQTPVGPIHAGTVLSATAGWSSTIAAMLGIKIPIVTHPLQAMVTEPLKPFIDKTLSSANLHVYVYQTDRGEVVIGGGVDPYPSYSHRSTLHQMQDLAAHVLEMLPCLREVKVMRQWTGLCDMSPDYAPIMGPLDGIEGFYMTAGWGTWGFKAGPIGGKSMAEFIVTGKTPDLIKHFGLDRFRTGRLVNERAAAPAAAIH
ncbi:MAG: FAD-dependent oxidoreductase [SAR202 cluster bacterium]|nr:FAD-dependent oxidoreductase [SAR202 cluster bacterium]